MDKIKFKYYICDMSGRILSEFSNYEDAHIEICFKKEMFPNNRYLMLKFVEEI